MKKFLQASLLFLFVAAGLVQANAKGNNLPEDKRYDYMYYQKSEIYIQYGAPSIIEVTGQLNNDTYQDHNHNLTFKGANYKYTGIGAVGYNFYLNPYFSLGAYFGISQAEMNVMEEESDIMVYHNHIKSYTGMIGANWIYFRQGVWEISSGVWLGVCYKDEEKSNITSDFIPKETDKATVAYNLTACKVRVGGTLGGFVELGFGYKGIVNAGLSVKF